MVTVALFFVCLNPNHVPEVNSSLSKAGNHNPKIQFVTRLDLRPVLPFLSFAQELKSPLKTRRMRPSLAFVLSVVLHLILFAVAKGMPSTIQDESIVTFATRHVEADRQALFTEHSAEFSRKLQTRLLPTFAW